MRRACTLILLVIGFGGTAHGQATPPALVNYQGVLRNASDAPQNGTFDMVFRLFDAAALGNEILVDSHLAAGTGGVVVTGGLFNTRIGGGAVADGAGPGLYASTAEVFRDHGSAYLEVQVGAEVLSPRIRVTAAPYALNADHLDGRNSTELAILGAANTFTVGPQTIQTGAAGNNGLVIRGAVGQLGTFWEARDSGGMSLAWLDATGGLHAQEFLGYGGSLTGLNASELVSGVVPSGRIGGLYSSAVTFGNAANSFTGDGSGLTNVSASTLDGLDSSQFLRRDIGDLFSGDTLQISGGSTLEVLGELKLNTRLHVNADGPDSDQFLYFYNDGSIFGEKLRWDEVNDRFELSNELAVDGPLRVGSMGAPVAYSQFGDGTPEHASGSNDVYVTGTLESDGTLYVQNGIYLRDAGPDGNQFIAFYEDGVVGLEQLYWNDGADRFEFTDELAVAGSIDLGPAAEDDLTASDVTTLTGGGNADALHTHASVGDADTLDGLDSTAFARLGTANTFTTGVQKVETGAAGNQGLVVRGAAAQTANLQEWQNSGSVVRASIGSGGTLTLNTGGGPDAAMTEDGIDRSNGASDSTFTIQNSGGTGKMTLQVDGVIRTGDPLSDATSYGYNRIALGVGAPPSGASMSLRNDLFVDGDLAANAQVYAGTRVIAESVIVVGDTTPNVSQAYSSFGTGTRDEVGIADANDVYVTGDLELDGIFYLASTIETAGNLVLTPPAGNDVIIGDGVSTANNSMRMGDGSLCIDDDGTCVPPVDGHIKAFVFDAAGHSDFAEVYPSEETLEAGDVVILDRGADGKVRRSTLPYEAGIISVISDKPGFVLGSPTDQELEAHALDPKRGPNFGDVLLVPGTYPVALMGRVPVKVTDEGGPIARGDYLTSSSTPGVAMKAAKPGSVIGQALEAWAGKGVGRLVVWVQPRWMGADPSGESTSGSEVARPEPVRKIAEVQGLDSNLQIALDSDADDEARFSLFRDGESKLGAEVFRVDEDGNVFAKGSFRPASLDLAEYHPVTEPVEPGDVLVVDRNHPGKLRKGSAASDPAVVGIVSAEPGVLMGSGISRIAAADPDLAAKLDDARARGDRVEEAALWKELEAKFSRSHAAIALSGTVSCKVDAGFGAIRVGDLLMASPTPGHAMRSSDQLAGTILGKALEPWGAGTGFIKVLVMLR